ncbi:S-methyl-5-thioribose-1-phosphate isomerase [Raoultibacter phocaeensis]|uniref:S-methyl-5-thioribose-1-phosphate isomerase n=1 Tax=Raoultibacter phocaeensis TaxID=2479841 RepID=UPI00111A1C2B|nr:S-methyl-5-thioribose-1-phosphate isomerase [Raoultibacter phocaeensis]
MGTENLPRTIEMVEHDGGALAARIVDQRVLPRSLGYRNLTTCGDMVEAIKTLALRGAPAIGIGGAAALALYAANESTAADGTALLNELEDVAKFVASARPTAVNLSWGVKRALGVARSAGSRGVSAADVLDELAADVRAMIAEDEAANRAIGAHGAALLGRDCRILTHCNAGSLATAFYGTALGVVYAASEQGKVAMVYADETRPVGQGSRLTAWELGQAGVPCTLICDNMAASIMAAGKVDAVVVGADRICANGDTANKIGTYGLAVLAKHHGVPFYIAAPTSTVDAVLSAGSQIPIEQRDATEVASFVPDGVCVFNPAFDVTPANLITAIVTERGVFEPESITQALG